MTNTGEAMATAGEAVKAWIEDVLKETLSPSLVAKKQREGSHRYYKQISLEHRGRYPFELLQNAHDACAEDGTRCGRAWFAWTDEALLVADSGRGIDREGVEALTSWGTTAKERGTTAIGHKGIGFVACYELTDTPQFFNSHDIHFGFNAIKADQQGLPPSYLPEFLVLGHAGPDEGICKELFASGATTIVRLPYKEEQGRGESRRLFDELLDVETLLFMPNLGSISLWDGDDRVEWTCKPTRRKPKFAKQAIDTCKSVEVLLVSNGTDRQDWLVAIKSTPAAEDDRKFVGWELAEELVASVAIPWHPNEAQPRPGRPRKVCAYYATEDETGCGILFHGDFMTTSTRKGVEGDASPTNAVELMLVEIAGALAADIATLGHKQVASLLVLLGVGPASVGYGKKLRGSVLNRIGTIPLLKMHGTRNLSTPSEARGVLGCDRGPTLHKLMDLLEDPTRYLDPSALPDVPDSILTELGTNFDNPSDLVSQVEPSGSNFDSVLNVLKEFVESLNYPGAVLAALRERPVVLTNDGAWVRPGQAHLEIDLPEAACSLLDVRIAAKSRRALQSFLEEHLQVGPVSVLEAMEQLSNQVSIGERSEQQKHEVMLLALRALFRHDREGFETFFAQGSGDRFGRLLVRTRAVDGTLGLRELGQGVYFSSDLAGDDILERLYGRFGEHEFLSEMPEETKAGRERQVAFFELLGVAHRPLVRDFEPSESDECREDYLWLWRVCENDLHPYGSRRHSSLGKTARFKVLDRLEELLVHPTQQSSEALIELFRERPPEMPKDSFSCHGKQNCVGRVEPRIGTSERLLKEWPWVPFEGWYLPMRKFWKNAPANRNLRLPIAPEGLDKVNGVTLVDYQAPKNEQLCVAQDWLYEDSVSSAVQSVDDVADTADWLLEQMANPTRGGFRSDSTQVKAILGHRSGQREWIHTSSTDTILVWDLPGFELISNMIEQPVAYVPDIDLSPLTKRNGGHNSLELASEHLHVEAKFESESEPTQLLDDLLMAGLVALVQQGLQRYLANSLAVLEWRCGIGLQLSYEDPQGNRVGSEVPAVAFLDGKQSLPFLKAIYDDGPPDDAKPVRATLYYDTSAEAIDQLDELGLELLRLLPIWARSDAKRDFQLLCKTPSKPRKLRRSFGVLSEDRLTETRSLLEVARGHATEEANNGPGASTGKEPVKSETTQVLVEADTVELEATVETGADAGTAGVGRSGDRSRTAAAAHRSEVGDPSRPDQPVRSGERSREGPSTTYPDQAVPIRQVEVEPTHQQASRIRSGRDRSRQREPYSVEGRSGRPVDSEDNAVNLEHERSSIRTATRVLEEKYGATVEDLSREVGWGYDLLCTIEGRQCYVEVKSHATDPQDLEFTPNEVRALGQEADEYWVVYVVGTTQDKHVVRVLRGLHDSQAKFKAVQPPIEKYVIPSDVWERHVEKQFELAARPESRP